MFIDIREMTFLGTGLEPKYQTMRGPERDGKSLVITSQKREREKKFEKEKMTYIFNFTEL